MNGRNGKERRAGHGIGILMDGAMGMEKRMMGHLHIDAAPHSVVQTS